MLVNVIKANHSYTNKDGALVKAELGEHDLPDLVAKAMIESGKAVEVVKKVEPKTTKK